MAQLWTEKHRPHSFNEIKGQKEIIKRIKSLVEQKNIPHLLFAGPVGTGKTTTALIIAKELFKEHVQENFLELNASVTGDTPILIKKDGNIKRTNFKELAEEYFDNNYEKRKFIKGVEILSINKKDYKIKFSKVDYIFRHKVNKIVNIKYEGGNIKTSLDHSIIIFDEKGNLIKKRCKDLKKGDLLISFKTELEGKNVKMDLTKHKLQTYNLLKSGLIKNPKIKTNFNELPLTSELSWMFGLYTAEGCTSLKNNITSGQVIFTFGYPQEQGFVDNTKKIFSDLNIPTYECMGKSGFDRSRESSIQLRILNTQLTKFIRSNFYDLNEQRKNARSKRIFPLIFNANIEQRLSFLRGYHDGDGCGNWGDFGRISSNSKECLIDATWLAKISGIEASHFNTETRLIWKNIKFSYIKSQLLPSNIFINIIKNKKENSKENLRYLLRHQLYSKKVKRINKETAKQFLEHIKNYEVKENLNKLIQSDIYVLKINDIKMEEQHNYVYDVSVPQSQMFFGGTNPILLHNSDDRGIDTVRVKIKDFARTKSLKEIPFKIILLDECDSLTKDAQQALRRTMETYSNTCRFILSCNKSSKIMEPIQSRCAVFRFKPLTKEDIGEIIDEIVKNEGLKINKEIYNLLYEVSEGDTRRLQNILQSSATLSNEITEETIYESISLVKPKEIKNIIELALNKKFIESRNLLLNTMLNNGLSGLDVIKQILKEIDGLKISDEKRLYLIDKCGEIEFRITEGADEYIQLECLLANFGK